MGASLALAARLLLPLVLVGCVCKPLSFGSGGGSNSEEEAPPPPPPATIVRDETYKAVDELIKQANANSDLGRMLVATLVDINRVQSTSMFGRQVMEFIAARLAQKGRDVIHATVRQDHMIVRDEGQFLLSRDIRNLVRDYNAKQVVVGTYGLVEREVFVSLRLVSTVDDSILAGVDFTLERVGAAEDMLRESAQYWQ